LVVVVVVVLLLLLLLLLIGWEAAGVADRRACEGGHA
jgi:hypothetical protein